MLRAQIMADKERAKEASSIRIERKDKKRSEDEANKLRALIAKVVQDDSEGRNFEEKSSIVYAIVNEGGVEINGDLPDNVIKRKFGGFYCGQKHIKHKDT